MDWTWAWIWWSIVVAIGTINFGIGIYVFRKSRKEENAQYVLYRKKMRIAGLIFLSVAFYRSIFVSRYLTQLAWFDTILNSALLIRTFAMFAEIAFAYLIMSALLQVNKELWGNETLNKGLRFFKQKAPIVFFVLLVAAQPLAYGGTIFKLRLLFAIEETFWGLAFMVVTPVIIMQLKKVFSFKDKEIRSEYKLIKVFTVFVALFCIGYGSYSVFYHLPIEYWPSAIEQLRMDVPAPAIQTGFQAFKDAFLIVNKTYDYEAWGGLGFVIWHTGYFTLCGWMTLVFMNGPRKLK